MTSSLTWVAMIVFVFALSDANLSSLISAIGATLSALITAVVGYLGLKLNQERREIARREQEYQDEKHEKHDEKPESS